MKPVTPLTKSFTPPTQEVSPAADQSHSEPSLPSVLHRDIDALHVTPDTIPTRQHLDNKGSATLAPALDPPGRKRKRPKNIEKEIKKTVRDVINHIIKKIEKSSDLSNDPFPNAADAVIEQNKIYHYTLDPFSAERKIRKHAPQKIEFTDKEKKETQDWQKRTAQFQKNGFPLRPTIDTNIEEDQAFKEGGENLISQIKKRALSCPAILTQEKDEALIGHVVMPVSGEKGRMHIKTWWKYDDLTTGENSDNPRLTTIIPQGNVESKTEEARQS